MTMLVRLLHIPRLHEGALVIDSIRVIVFLFLAFDIMSVILNGFVESWIVHDEKLKMLSIVRR